MEDRAPTIRSRELGEGLRQAMTYAGYHASEIARLLDWSPSRVSRLLSGKRGGTGYDVSAFLAVCGVKGAERDRLMALTVDQDKKGWFQQHGPVLPKQVRTLIDHESMAVSMEQVESIIVPGLLQTGDYARAVISRNVNVPAGEVDDRVAARLARQSVLSRRQPPTCTFFLHEFVLRTPVGSSLTMSDQLHHLLRVAVRPHITVRVLPAAVGAHAAMSGPFTLLDVKAFKPIVYLDSETSSLFLELPVEIDAYRNILATLEDTALDEGQSRELIASVATELYADGESDDHPGRVG
ncbi:helix-turn-helix domain-containing protein [Haloechinothrix sp. YIM 98757]|uniref:Helix-turn-helix domain-containing protein n=1 Tax=Haloechinothrix aidingensis TaxID=2752311 RepID=A0A837ZV64_9PSEU|nr:helix-turn-helix transcriptional regulator [Haloechinothrix aidingensis]MBA0124516.1 helix-turn-helix domain-containing protein [Haloechinothrix aidingensis]